MLELFQTRANPASKKDFHWVRPGCCQVANPLQIKEEDVDRLCFIGVLGAYRPRHSVILAHRGSLRITARDCYPGKVLCQPYPTKLCIRALVCSLTQHISLKFPYHLVD